MGRPLRLTIPWKHLASSNTRNQRRGGKAHGWDYKHAKHAIEMIAKNAVPASKRPVFDGDCRVDLLFYPPDRRRRDVPNTFKATLDALSGIVYADDFEGSRAGSWDRKDPDPDNPRCEVTVWPIE